MFINEQYVGADFNIAFDVFITIHAMAYMETERDRDIIFTLCNS